MNAHAESMSLSDEIDMPKSRTHRGKRSRGKGAMSSHANHAEAKQEMKAAEQAATPAQAHAHLFKALSFLKKCD